MKFIVMLPFFRYVYPMVEYIWPHIIIMPLHTQYVQGSSFTMGLEAEKFPHKVCQ